jgi:plasmid stability protein
VATPNQITLRNPSPELAERLRAIAAARGESLNATILRLLEEAVGVDERRRRLQRYATWNDDDLREFGTVLRDQRTIDERLWG